MEEKIETLWISSVDALSRICLIEGLVTSLGWSNLLTFTLVVASDGITLCGSFDACSSAQK
jgi:hypothetical protein